MGISGDRTGQISRSRPVFFKSGAFGSTLATALLTIALPCHAASVTNASDSGSGSFRETVPTASDNETVILNVPDITLTTGTTILVQGNNVIIDGTGSGTPTVFSSDGSLVWSNPILTQNATKNGLSLRGVSFSGFSGTFTSELNGGGLVAASNNSSSASFGSLTSVSMTGNRIEALQNVIGGGLVGVQSRDAAAMGDLTGLTFSGNAVEAGSSIRGGGLVGTYSRDAEATLGAVDGFLSGNTVSNSTRVAGQAILGGGLVGVASQTGSGAHMGTVTARFANNVFDGKAGIQGGGLVGSVIWAGTGNATMGTVSGSFDDNRVSSRGLMEGGGMVGVQSYQGDSQLFGVDGSASFTGNAVVVGSRIQGGGLVGVTAGNGGGSRIESVGGTYVNNTVQAGQGLFGGGVVGASAIGAKEATIGATDTIMSGNRIAVSGSAYAGGLIGVYATGGGDAGLGEVAGRMAGNALNATGTLYGGGLVGSFSDGAGANSTLGIIRATMTGNEVTVGGNLYGGGLVGSWHTSNAVSFDGIRGAVFTGNTVTVGSSGQNEIVATGGLAGFSGLDKRADFVDMTMTGNTVRFDATTIREQGGLVFVSTDRASSNADGHHVLLGATAGNVTRISGNRVLMNGTDKTYSFVFGRDWDGGLGARTSSLADARFSVESATGATVILDHPVSVDMDNGRSFTMDVSGPGLFHWNGRNALDAQGGASVRFESGSNVSLGRDFSLSAANPATGGAGGPLRVEIKDGNTLVFDARRDSNAAMFDFTTASNQMQPGSFIVGQGLMEAVPSVELDTSRSLRSFEKRYLVADGIADIDRDAAGFLAGQGVIGFDRSQDGQLWVNVDFSSPYHSIIDTWKNLMSAAPTLEALVNDDVLVSGTEVDFIFNNLYSATPDHIVNQSVIGIQAASDVASFAIRQAFRAGNRQLRGPEMSGIQLADSGTFEDPGEEGRGLRVWGSYIGQFGRQGSHDRYRGYNHNLNGVVVGVSYDASRQISLGLYGAYTHGHAKTKGANSTVDSEGFHVGALAKIRPLDDLPSLATVLDVGYAHTSNDGERHVGMGALETDFDQNIVTVGLGIENAFRVDTVTITPFLNGRYAYLDQGRAGESGGLTSTLTEGVHGESLSSELGAEVSTRLLFEDGVVVPRLSLSWSHEFADAAFSTSSRYNGAGGGLLVPYPVHSVEKDRDSVNLGIGLQGEYKLSDSETVRLGLTYDFRHFSHSETHAVALRLDYAF